MTICQKCHFSTTISQKSGEEEHSTMMIETISGLRSTSYKNLSDSEDSQQTDISTLEDSVRDETVTKYNGKMVIQKTGELLGNMHTILVKKCLSDFFATYKKLKNFRSWECCCLVQQEQLPADIMYRLWTLQRTLTFLLRNTWQD